MRKNKHAEKETVEVRPKRVQPMLFVGDGKPSSPPERRTVRLAYLGTWSHWAKCVSYSRMYNEEKKQG